MDEIEAALGEPGSGAADLCELALRGGGGRDNITVVVVSVLDA